MSRWLHFLVGFVMLAAVASSGRGYLYCQMMERAAAFCCCSGGNDTAVPSAHEVDTPKVVRTSCCSWRDGEAGVPNVSVFVQRDLLSLDAPPFGATYPVPKSSFVFRAQVVVVVADEAPPVARGSPHAVKRRGKRRARLAVTLC